MWGTEGSKIPRRWTLHPDPKENQTQNQKGNQDQRTGQNGDRNGWNEKTKMIMVNDGVRNNFILTNNNFKVITFT